MKILKMGKKPKDYTIKTFECDVCGCVFEANDKEYNTQLRTPELIHIYSCVCPCCGRNIIGTKEKNDEIKNKI